jgi:hypothetical protein
MQLPFRQWEVVARRRIRTTKWVNTVTAIWHWEALDRVSADGLTVCCKGDSLGPAAVPVCRPLRSEMAVYPRLTWLIAITEHPPSMERPGQRRFPVWQLGNLWRVHRFHLKRRDPNRFRHPERVPASNPAVLKAGIIRPDRRLIQLAPNRRLFTRISSATEITNGGRQRRRWRRRWWWPSKRPPRTKEE